MTDRAWIPACAGMTNVGVTNVGVTPLFVIAGQTRNPWIPACAGILSGYPYLEAEDITATLEYAARQFDHPVLQAA